MALLGAKGVQKPIEAKSGVIFHFFGATSSSAKPTEDGQCDWV
jgi:hypothetical protein